MRKEAKNWLKGYYIIERREIPPKTHNLLELCLELNLPDEILGITRELTPEFIIKDIQMRLEESQQNFMIKIKPREFLGSQGDFLNG
jgi:HEPN domain-containing protein